MSGPVPPGSASVATAPGSAAPVPPPALPPLPYHRLLRVDPGYRWWRPLLALAMLVVLIVLGTLVVLVVGLIIGLSTGDVRVATLADDLTALALIDATSPLSLFVGLGSVAIWLPAVPLALLIAGIRPVGLVHSVLFRIRWRWLLACVVPSAVVVAAAIAVTFFTLPLMSGAQLGPMTTPLPTFLVSMAMVLLLVPFQAAAEEYVFRGIITQAIGAWVRWLPVALVVPTLLFAAGHIYDIWGLIDVSVFGITAAFVTWRTGGLEAAIVLHALNNIAAFAVLASGVTGGTSIGESGSSPSAIAVSVVTMAGFALWVDRMAARRGLARLAIPRG
jgi:membrane protease YdiL (CAAX protease family)